MSDKNSVLGYMFLLGGCPVSWRSTKQQTEAKSTAEAEYIPLGAAVRKLSLASQLLSEKNFSQEGTTKLYGDNIAVRSLAENPVSTSICRNQHMRRQGVIQERRNPAYN